MRRHQSQQGLSIVEIVVALGLLSVSGFMTMNMSDQRARHFEANKTAQKRVSNASAAQSLVKAAMIKKRATDPCFGTALSSELGFTGTNYGNHNLRVRGMAQNTFDAAIEGLQPTETALVQEIFEWCNAIGAQQKACFTLETKNMDNVISFVAGRVDLYDYKSNQTYIEAMGSCDPAHVDMLISDEYTEEQFAGIGMRSRIRIISIDVEDKRIIEADDQEFFTGKSPIAYQSSSSTTDHGTPSPLSTCGVCSPHFSPRLIPTVDPATDPGTYGSISAPREHEIRNWYNDHKIESTPRFKCGTGPSSCIAY